MANFNNVNGLIPIGCMSGADWHSKLRRVCFLATDNTATFIGDLVKLAGSASADGTAPSVAQSAAGNASVGVLVSLEPDFTNESTLSAANYRPASVLRYGYVAWGSDVLYSCQEDSDGGALVAADAADNINVIVGAGNTITGLSGMQLDSSTADVANTLQLRLHSVDTTLGNTLGANARWVVSINLDQDVITTGVA